MVSFATRSPLLTVMIRAAEKAAKGLVRDFGEVEHLQVSKKGPGDFVSQADIKAEKTLVEELSKGRPDFGFLLEEGGTKKGKSNDRWIIDPLDGTLNFLHGIPHWAISIAAEIDGKLTAGVVYNPVQDEMYYAERGIGAFRNNHRLRVSSRKGMSSALFATGFPWIGKDKGPFYEQMKSMSNKVAGHRRMGSAALDLAYVAAGRFDGYWEAGLAPWDIAAGVVLVEEAGGKITNYVGKDFDIESFDILASNYVLHPKMMKALADI